MRFACCFMSLLDRRIGKAGFLSARASGGKHAG
jgi:hypothetical protein